MGAAFAFFWWLVFTPGVNLVKKIRLVFPLLLMISFFQPCPGNFQREWPFVFHPYDRNHPYRHVALRGAETGRISQLPVSGCSVTGQGLTSVWLPKWVCSPSHAFTADVERIRVAEKIKGLRWGVRSLIPSGHDPCPWRTCQGRGFSGAACDPRLPVRGDIVPGIFDRATGSAGRIICRVRGVFCTGAS